MAATFPRATTDLQSPFAARLSLVMKALAISRGQLASAVAVDKSIVSRWLSGATLPTEHNLTRVTAHVAGLVPGFTMFDWDADLGALSARLGVADGRSGETTSVRPEDLPGFATLPAFAASRFETSARGDRYCGLWRSWMPTVGEPDRFHCEHTVVRRRGAWLEGVAVGVGYEWPFAGFVANGQLILVMSDVADFVIRQFNRVDAPIVEQVDGLMLAATSQPHQAPVACRVIMSRVLPAEAGDAEIDAALAERAEERRFHSAATLEPGLAADLLPDSGPVAAAGGGDRLLRADSTGRLSVSRWF